MAKRMSEILGTLSFVMDGEIEGYGRYKVRPYETEIENTLGSFEIVAENEAARFYVIIEWDFFNEE